MKVNDMEVKRVSEKVIHGLCTRTDNATEMTPNKGKIPALWQRFDESVPVDYKGGERVYGVYFDYETDHTGEFTVLAGFDGKTLPADVSLQEVIIPAAKYLVFTHKGEMPQIAIDAWTEVWNYFSEGHSEYERLYSMDFEYYPSAGEIAVHIAIK
ncbi:GyrI-like domain-containing protein [Marinibactrum halimedae]|uniref:Transcriptional regulator n=1 Tax=Marinibactrum halimedae TaxID=1444977 RepID=A0AA37T981_9GAMM|nr:effector binding domain-containing protein [Marinibactrum halimedae]MCD9457899.1 effector binding domain-containing protein [Marinibactrum halimedae]GLS26276.1 transcriptional regulator [Marinibactrum halimedae]